MTANVNGVIRYLRDVGLEEAQLVDDVELNRLLDPYRAVYPIPYKCQKERCKTTLAYWAIHSTGARIAPAPSRVDRKGVRAGTQPRAPTYRPGRPQPPSEVIVGGTADLRYPGLDFNGRFEEPIEWALNGDGIISLETNPTVGSPWPLRWKFTCPRCNSQYTHTNTDMLRLFLGALFARRSEIRPGTIR